MKNKQNLYVLAGIVIMMIFALPQASAAESDNGPAEGATAEENSAWWTSRGYIAVGAGIACLLYTSPSPRDGLLSRMPSSA